MRHIVPRKVRLTLLRRPLLAACAVLSLLCAGSAQTTVPAKPATAVAVISAARAKLVYPLEVELLHGLNARSMHPEQTVDVRLEADWSDGVCTLPRKTVLPGRVLRREEKDGRYGSVAIQFEYRCAGREGPQRLTWISLLAPEMYDILDTRGKAVVKQTFRSSSFGEGDLARDSGVKSGDMSGRSNPSLPLFTDSLTDHHGLRPTAVEVGQVWHLPKLELQAGTGPEGSSVLSTTEKQVKLPAQAVLVLMPERLMRRPALPPMQAGVAPAKATPAVGAVAGPTAPAVPAEPLLPVKVPAQAASDIHREFAAGRIDGRP